MGENEEWAESGGPFPNGLVPGSGPVLQAIDSNRWSRAEDRTAELIAVIQPNQLSEERRNAVADFVQRLITKCFPCQVCTFGSVPLKTYLPDGDIDLSAFSHDQNLKDTWAYQVRDMLQNEEKKENAEFQVKEVQYIQAEVKIIKCLVENIVVDISFNQVGGLCTLCFLDEVDHLINQNHLFKRSIILIKAWCYYESRILGAHHGLISTYALETLVLYIFHVFNNSFLGPLEVLYRFLEFFSNFDWDNFCVSLWGPVPICSLPDVTAEPPRRDSGELLLSKLFLDACSSVYAVIPSGQENNGQPFVSKHFNVIDPLRVNNNLGRSVSKGNFFRIRSAFAFGAKKLARLLDCPEENIKFEVNEFFMNTWDRHGSGHRPDAIGIESLRTGLSTPDALHEFRNNVNQNRASSLCDTEDTSIHGVPSQHNKTSSLHTKSLKSPKANCGTNDIHGRFLARTSSSPELTATYSKSESINTRVPFEQSLDVHADVSGEEFQSTSCAMHQEQGIVNMMACASLQGLNGQFHVPLNLNSSHLPLTVPPSFLASMGYAQRNLPGFVPANHIPLMDPSFSNLQFPSNLLSPHYFSPSETPVEQGNNDFGSVEVMNSEEVDSDFWNEQNVGTGNGNPKTRASDDKPVSVFGLKYIPPHRLNTVDGASRVQQKHPKEKHGPARQEQSESEVYAEERSASSRFSLETHSNSLRSRPSSESSFDGSSAKTPKPKKEKRGKKILSSEELVSKIPDHMANQTENEDAEMVGRHSGPNSVSSLQIPAQKIPSVFEVAPTSGEVAQTNGSDSTMPFGPMLISPSGSTHRVNENSGLVAFYPTGPPVPFLTMLPILDSSSAHFGRDEALENSDFGHNFSSKEYDHHPEDLNPFISSQKKNPDILNSDFASHWQNLQLGRFYQNPPHYGPLVYPSPVMVPPAYLQGGQFNPFDGSCRPFSTNTNLFSQLMASYGQRVVPVGPIQSVSNRPNVYQNYLNGVPRYRSGTGTYLPNPVPIRERHSSGTKKGNYNHYDRNDSYGDKEGNWNSNSKSRSTVRNHGRNHTDKSNSRTDRFYYPSQNGQSSLSLNQNGPHTAAYNMYSLSALNPNGVSSGPSTPPFMMLYPFEHNNAVYGSRAEQLEFGSLGPSDLQGMDEHLQLQLNEGTQARVFHQSSDQYSPPDQPASPHHQRRS